jgi:prevent-host-death family protein
MTTIPQIRPISDLRNNFAEVARTAHRSQKPVYLTKNGRADLVVMSIEAYEQDLFEAEIYRKLREAEIEARTTTKRYTHEELFRYLEKAIDSFATNDQEVVSDGAK